MPNLVNHSISLFYNEKYKLIPSSILKEDIVNKNYSLDIFFILKMENEKK